MSAYSNVGEPKRIGNLAIGLVDECARYRAPGDLGLIGNHDEQIAEFGEFCAGLRYAAENRDIFRSLCRVWLAVPNDCTNEHPIAIEEDRPMLTSVVHGDTDTLAKRFLRPLRSLEPDWDSGSLMGDIWL